MNRFHASRTPRTHVRMLFRITVSVLCLWIATISPANAVPQLKTRIIVNSANVTFGDAITGLSEEERARSGIDRIVYMAAPAPGTTRTVPAARLAEAARSVGIAIESLPDTPRIEISRAGNAVSNSAIEQRIGDRLRGRAGATGLRVQLTSQTPTIYVPSDVDAGFEIVELHHQPDRERFTALLRAPANDLRAPTYEVRGSAYPTVRVPVLRRAIEKGERIAAEDVTIIHLRATKATTGLVSRSKALIGMTPKRYLRPGQPVRTADIKLPTVIGKGESVIISYTSPGISLTAQGRALENGALGQAIRVVNTQTNRTIEANVSGPGRVQVLSPSSRSRFSQDKRLASSR